MRSEAVTVRFWDRKRKAHEDPRQAGVTARRCVECRDERFPRFAVECEQTPVGQPLLSLAECRVEHEFAHGLAFGRCRGLQRLLCGRAQPEIQLLGAVRTSTHLASWSARIPSPARQCHDKIVSREAAPRPGCGLEGSVIARSDEALGTLMRADRLSIAAERNAASGTLMPIAMGAAKIAAKVTG